MIQHTSEWVAKAEGDYATATRELAVGPDSNFDAVAFHAQQCAEKYLKARLIEEGATFPKTHDLAAILDLLISFEPGWDTLRAELERLTDRAVEVRYPGYTADLADAEQSLQTARKVRQLVRASLGLPAGP